MFDRFGFFNQMSKRAQNQYLISNVHSIIQKVSELGEMQIGPEIDLECVVKYYLKVL